MKRDNDGDGGKPKADPKRPRLPVQAPTAGCAGADTNKHASVPVPSAGIPASGAPGGGTFPNPTNFVERLMHVLENDIANDCVWWVGERGNMVAINPSRMKKSPVWVKLFQGCPHSAFTRLMTQWGFRRIPDPSTKDSLVELYQNHLFLQKKPHLVKQMKMQGDAAAPASTNKNVKSAVETAPGQTQQQLGTNPNNNANLIQTFLAQQMQGGQLPLGESNTAQLAALMSGAHQGPSPSNNNNRPNNIKEPTAATVETSPRLQGMAEGGGGAVTDRSASSSSTIVSPICEAALQQMVQLAELYLGQPVSNIATDNTIRTLLKLLVVLTELQQQQHKEMQQQQQSKQPHQQSAAPNNITTSIEQLLGQLTAQQQQQQQQPTPAPRQAPAPAPPPQQQPMRQKQQKQRGDAGGGSALPSQQDTMLQQLLMQSQQQQPQNSQQLLAGMDQKQQQQQQQQQQQVQRAQNNPASSLFSSLGSSSSSFPADMMQQLLGQQQQVPPPSSSSMTSQQPQPPQVPQQLPAGGMNQQDSGGAPPPNIQELLMTLLGQQRTSGGTKS